MNNERFFKCQGHRHIASNCPDHRVITLAKWTAIQEVFKEDENKDDFEDELKKTQEEVAEGASGG